MVLPQRPDLVSRIPARIQSGSSGSRGSAPDVLDAVMRSLRLAGLSRQAAEVAAQSQRASTRRVYDCRLCHFFKWCRRRAIHPADTSVEEVGDFLLYLFDSGLGTATVKNYRSAIAAVHGGFVDGLQVSDNRAIRQLAKGMFVTHPPVRKLVPSWDLLLTALTKPPFEPLSGATLLHLSVKLAFLVAVATSRKRSELQDKTKCTGVRFAAGTNTCFGPWPVFTKDLNSTELVQTSSGRVCGVLGLRIR